MLAVHELENWKVQLDVHELLVCSNETHVLRPLQTVLASATVMPSLDDSSLRPAHARPGLRV